MTGLGRYRWLLLAVAIALSTLPGVAAAGSGFATGGGSFTRIGPSARAIGLGRAYVALAGEDPMGLFWISASVAQGEGIRVSVTNRVLGPAELGMDGALSFGAGGITSPVGWGGFYVGAGAMFLGISGIEQYNSQAVFEGEFSDAEMLAVMSLGRVEGPVCVGLSARYISQGFSGLAHFGSTTQSGVGLETSLTTQFWRSVRLGASLSSQVDLEHDRVPMRGLVGLAYDREVWLSGRSASILAALDVEQIADRPVRVHVGLGLERLEVYSGVEVALRMGRSNRMLEPRVTSALVENLDPVEKFDPMDGEDYVGASAQWTMGLGIRRGPVAIDYAVAFGMLHDTQYVSLGYSY